MVEKLRIRISQIFVVLLVILTCVSGSRWEDQAPFLPAVLFLILIAFAGYYPLVIKSEQN